MCDSTCVWFLSKGAENEEKNVWKNYGQISPKFEENKLTYPRSLTNNKKITPRCIFFKLLNRRKFWKAEGKNDPVHTRENIIQMLPALLSETTEAQRQWSDIFKGLRKKILLTQNSMSSKKYLQYWRQRHFSIKRKKNCFGGNRSALQEMLKEALQPERN